MEYNFIRIDNNNCEANNNTLCKEHRCEVFLENNYGFVKGVGKFLNHKAIPYPEAIHNYIYSLDNTLVSINISCNSFKDCTVFAN